MRAISMLLVLLSLVSPGIASFAAPVSGHGSSGRVAVTKPAKERSAIPKEHASALLLTVKGAVNPVMASFLARGIDEAEKRGAKLLVIRMDTPGGLDQAMRDIVQREEGSPVPVVLYVSPTGARAASAGLFIAMGAHVAAMAPGTSIGAAHPVAAGGEEIKGHMAKKVEHEAAAYIRGLAKKHGRNVDWAEKAVRQSVSLSASEALAKGVVEIVASDVSSLLRQLDGRRVKMTKGPLTLRTRDLALKDFEMTGLERFLFAITDPNIAFMLLNLGMLGLFFELSSPGAVLPGIVGGICLLLALFGLGMLPVNYAGLALIALAFLLFAAELVAASHGALLIGGVVSLVFGGLILMSGSTPGIEVSSTLVTTVALATGGLLAGCLTVALGAQRRRVQTGREDLIGRTTQVRIILAPEGQVFLEGERWQARALNPPIEVGADVVVRSIEGLTLVVERAVPN